MGVCDMEIQKRVVEWFMKRYGKQTWGIVAQYKYEAQRLVDILQDTKSPYFSEEEKEIVKNTCAHVLICLYRIADCYGIDLLKSVESEIKKREDGGQ